VVPLIKGGVVHGVLDLDSPNVGRFDEKDQAGFEKVVSLFVSRTEFADA
jgi:GAF domain-containing protein